MKTWRIVLIIFALVAATVPAFAAEKPGGSVRNMTRPPKPSSKGPSTT